MRQRGTFMPPVDIRKLFRNIFQYLVGQHTSQAKNPIFPHICLVKGLYCFEINLYDIERLIFVVIVYLLSSKHTGVRRIVG